MYAVEFAHRHAYPLSPFSPTLPHPTLLDLCTICHSFMKSFLSLGCVYAVEFAHRPGRDLINMAKSRTNVIPIIEDAR